MPQNILILLSHYDVFLTQLLLFKFTDFNIHFSTNDLEDYFTIVDSINFNESLPESWKSFGPIPVNKEVFFEKEWDIIVCSSPEQIEDLRKIKLKFYRKKSFPKIIYHNCNPGYKFKFPFNVNIISPNQLLIKKFKGNKIFIRHYPYGVLEREYKNPGKGFYSYINRYERLWEKGFKEFQTIQNKNKDIDIKYFGKDSPYGMLNARKDEDIEKIKASKATLHIKDKCVQCYAVTKSLCSGRPVILPSWIYKKGDFNDIILHKKNGFIYHTVLGANHIIRKLNKKNSYLNAICMQTKEMSKKIFDISLVKDQFINFLNNLQ